MLRTFAGRPLSLIISKVRNFIQFDGARILYALDKSHARIIETTKVISRSAFPSLFRL